MTLAADTTGSRGKQKKRQIGSSLQNGMSKSGKSLCGCIKQRKYLEQTRAWT